MRQTKILEKAKKQELFLLDVRTKDEYAQGHIPTATLLPLDELLKGNIKGLPQDTLICVYCRTGRRSGVAKKVLKKAGYKVKNIGGILSWKLDIKR